jgi:hypothetical protein
MKTLSEIVSRYNLEPIIPFEGDINLVDRLPSKQHIVLRGFSNDKKYVVKLTRNLGWQTIYQKSPTWFLEPVGMYVGKYLAIITPWVGNIKPDLTETLDCCSAMIESNVFYLDWYDSNNFSIVDGKLKVIDLDCAFVSYAGYHQAESILIPILLQDTTVAEAVRWYQKCQTLASLPFEQWKSAVLELLAEKRKAVQKKDK